jgi:hypothetical protein
MDDEKDRDFFLSFGLVVSTRLSDVQKIREAVEAAGGKIVFQTTTTAPLYLLRHYQIETILKGDVSQIREIHEKKRRRVEK